MSNFLWRRRLRWAQMARGMDDKQLLKRLALMEALHAGAATPGGRDAAAPARERIPARPKRLQSGELE